MRCTVSAKHLGIGLFAGLLCFPWTAFAANESETAELLIKLVQAGRTVVTEHQELLNDPSKGDKGFTPEYFSAKVIDKYRDLAKIDLNRPPATPQSGLLLTLLESGKEVVAEAQPVLNKQGVAFKGFIPAVWGRKTGEKFTRKTGMKLKLTALEYRYPGNKPDDFETEALRLFSDPSYPKGKEFSRVMVADGRQVLRMMKPEYLGPKCLGCHGEPKGERDKTGMKKEGMKEGDLAGAISLTIPVR
jgi:hypothetical protein